MTAPAKTAAPAQSDKPVEDAPRLRLEANRLLLDDQPYRLDLLFDAMKARRSEQPSGPTYHLTVADEANGAQLKSAVQSATTAGWPLAVLELGEKSVALHALVPGAPGEPPSTDLSWPEESLVIVVRTDSVELLRAKARPPEDEGAMSLGMIAPHNVSSVLPQLLQTACANGRACSPALLIVAEDAPFSLINAALRPLTALPLEAERPVVELRVKQPQPEEPGTPRLEVGGVGPTVSGRLAPELIAKTIRQSFDKYRKCYEAGLERDPKLTGRIVVRFVIGRDGKVPRAATGTETTMPDARVTQCVVRHFRDLQFPAPEGGIVTVTYPLVLPLSD